MDALIYIIHSPIHNNRASPLPSEGRASKGRSSLPRSILCLGARISEEMDGETKIEADLDHSPTNGFPVTVDSLPQGSSSKSQNRDRDSPASAASAKRRCVSTACIACRRRKSKVGLEDLSPATA